MWVWFVLLWLFLLWIFEFSGFCVLLDLEELNLQCIHLALQLMDFTVLYCSVLV